ALAAWAGDGAVPLLRRDAARGALLLGRAVPGRTLAQAMAAATPPDPIAVSGEVLRRLSRPGAAARPRGDVPPLAALARRWAGALPRDWARTGRPCPSAWIDAALSALEVLSAGAPSPPVLLHLDLHGGNLVEDRRHGWRAIDPMPALGDPAFAPAPVVRAFEHGHSRSAAIRRLDRSAEALNLDRERARLWSLAQTLAWAMRSDWRDRHLQTVGWLLEA
ncbi:MAG: aminoglycoside phosphotransferase family protein, partial [Pseudomonadota bacterium]